MAGKREKPEDIVTKLRQVEVLQGQGMNVAEAVRQIGVTQQTYYRWRRQYGGMSRDQLKRLKELEKENAPGQADPDRGGTGKLLSPSRRRRCIDRVRQTLGVSERRACRTLGQHRSTQRKVPEGRSDEDLLTADIIELATQYGRYGYRPVTALLNQAGWNVNHKRVERIWRREGLKIPPKQKKRSRLWLNDGSCIRLRPERPNHVWSYDFVQDRTHDGRPYRILVILDEFTREALMLRVARKLNSTDVIDALTDLFILRGPPEYSPLSTMRIFSSGECRFRVARRMSLTTFSGGSLGGPDFCLISTPSRVTMRQKSSLTQEPRSVPRVLTPDMEMYFV